MQTYLESFFFSHTYDNIIIVEAGDKWKEIDASFGLVMKAICYKVPNNISRHVNIVLVLFVDVRGE